MPVDSTKAMPSNTSRSETRGRPVRPCTAGLRGGISGSTSAHSSSLISRGGGEDADDDMPGTLRRRLSGRQSPTTYFRNVFLVTVRVAQQRLSAGLASRRSSSSCCPQFGRKELGGTLASSGQGCAGSCCLHRRRERADVIGALVPAAVDEEGRGAADAGGVGALDVPVDPTRVPAFGEVAGEPVRVQAEFARVADEVDELELVLAPEQQVVHFPERALPGGGLARLGGLAGVRVHVVERQVPPNVGEAGELAQQLANDGFGPAAVGALEVAVLHYGHGGVKRASVVVDLGIHRRAEVEQVDRVTEECTDLGASR